MPEPVIRRPPKTAASVLAGAMARRKQGEPPPDDTITGWLRDRPERLAWAVCNRPAECLMLGLIDRPIPLALINLRHANLPLDSRFMASVRLCLNLAGVTREEVKLALADRAPLLQEVLGLMEGEQ